MAHAVDTSHNAPATFPAGTTGTPGVDSGKNFEEPRFNVAQPAPEIETAELTAQRPSFARSHAVALVSCALVIVVFAVLGFLFLKTDSGATATAAKPAPAVQVVAAPPAQLSAADIKEMKARDDYAARLSTSLHQRLPAYKNVKIYADSWLGNKAPSKGPLTDVKSRKGDNLMMVFWSPDAGTARGLADFAKSPAAIEAVNAGFAEFQFVDPDTYCYSLVVPVTGASAVTCGIR